jgi:hypothetical protein
MLVVKYLQLRSTFGWSLSNLVALLRQQLFVYRDLWAWIDDPFQPPPIPERLSEQLTLQLICVGQLDWTAAIIHTPTIRRNFEISRRGI